MEESSVSVKVNVDQSELDLAIEKAKQLKKLLVEIHKLIGSPSVESSCINVDDVVNQISSAISSEITTS